eukprot:11186677-Lingulodinium_polyedra.AAC.1
MTVSYFDEVTSTHRHHQVRVPPRIIQNAKGPCIYAAVNGGVPQFSIDSLVELCKSIRFASLSEFPDNAKSNRRK